MVPKSLFSLVLANRGSIILHWCIILFTPLCYWWQYCSVSSLDGNGSKSWRPLQELFTFYFFRKSVFQNSILCFLMASLTFRNNFNQNQPLFNFFWVILFFITAHLKYSISTSCIVQNFIVDRRSYTCSSTLICERLFPMSNIFDEQ